MPNLVLNLVIGDPLVLEDLGDPIDFNRIFPWEGGDVPGVGIFFEAEAAVKRGEDLSRLTGECGLQAQIMKSNLEKTGHVSILDWAKAKWGTKWNALSPKKLPFGRAFQTATSPAIPIVTELSRRHPNYQIGLVFAHENLGQDCGVLLFRSGEVIWEGRDLDRASFSGVVWDLVT